MEKLRIGVIGTGFGARVQIPGFIASGDFEVVAVVSGRERRAREVRSGSRSRTRSASPASSSRATTSTP